MLVLFPLSLWRLVLQSLEIMQMQQQHSGSPIERVPHPNQHTVRAHPYAHHQGTPEVVVKVPHANQYTRRPPRVD